MSGYSKIAKIIEKLPENKEIEMFDLIDKYVYPDLIDEDYSLASELDRILSREGKNALLKKIDEVRKPTSYRDIKELENRIEEKQDLDEILDESAGGN